MCKLLSYLYWNVICLLLTTSILSYAQQPKSFDAYFDGSIRYCMESWNNMNPQNYGSNPVVGESDDLILLQRIIAGTTLKFKNKITLSAHLQDSRAFGWSLGHGKNPDLFKVHPENNIEPSYIMNPQEEFFEIYDLNIRIDSILNMFSVIAGRQKIAYTDYRVLGPGSWGNTGRWTWDAIRFIIEQKKMVRRNLVWRYKNP